MSKTFVYDMSGKQVGEIELSAAVFGVEPNAALGDGFSGGVIREVDS